MKKQGVSPRRPWTLFQAFLFLSVFALWAPSIVLASGLLPFEPANQSAGPFAPDPDAVYLQKTDQGSALGNVRVIVELGASETARLAEHQGAISRFEMGGGEGPLVFRDDGHGADVVAGDGLYSMFATIDEGELAVRTDIEKAAGPTTLFEDRVALGHASVTPFDFEAFQAGAMVTYRSQQTPTQAVGVPTKMFTPGTTAFQDAVLMIRDPVVVADPARTFDPCTNTGTTFGVWTFGRIFQDLANTAQTGINPSVLAEMWLDHWLTNQTVNTFTVPQRLQMQQLINDWRAASGGGQLNLKIAPFRLLAIVPRVDLRDSQGLHAGEARFVFGVVAPDFYASNGSFIGSAGIPGTDTDGNGTLCDALRFSVIFEYRVPACGCEDVKDWATGWAKLGSVAFASPEYFDRLEKLTKIFSGPNSDILQPNSSALSQLRTNEVALAVPWELREFRLTVFPHSLFQQTTTADTPHDSFNNTATFTNFVTGGGGQVPLFFAGAPFLGGNPQVPPTFWDGPGLIPGFINERFAASIGTCNGCHFDETGTNFVHVSPQTPGLPATLSGFLTGISVGDPANGGTPIRTFDDLERREKDLNLFLREPCTTVLTFPYQGITTDDPLDKAASADAVAVSVSLSDLFSPPVRQVH